MSTTPRVATSLSLDKFQWEQIRGSNIHAAMMLNRVNFRIRDVITAEFWNSLHPWLEKNCNKHYYFADPHIHFLSRVDMDLFMMAFI